MKTRITALIVTSLAVLTLSGIAQQPSPPAGKNDGKPFRPNPEKRMEELKMKLGLTDDQAAKLKAIFEENAPARKAIMDDTSLTPEQKRAKMQELRKATEPKIASILTLEQKVKWEEMKKNHQNKMKEAAQNKKGDAAPASSPTN